MTPPGHPAVGQPSIAVVHIVLAQFGIAPFRDFIASYRRHAAGIGHSLVIAVKGFENGLPAAYVGLLDGIPHEAIEVPNFGFDIETYWRLATALDHQTFCFLNSRSVVLGDRWLARLVAPLSALDVGAAGASGSFQSLLEEHLRYLRRKPSNRGLRSIIRSSSINTLRHRLLFAPFPNPHLRTNAFAIARSTLLALPVPNTATRLATARFENGRNNFTRQLDRRGLKVVVVGRNGVAYEPSDWPGSGTFWQGDQANLMVDDNQTLKYAVAGPAERHALAAAAWTSQEI